MSVVADFWGPLLQLQAAVLPDAVWAQGWLRLGWGLVLGALVASAAAFAGRRWGVAPGRAQGLARGLGLLALLWCVWPGEASAAFWLGLAFQAPSLSSGALGAVVLVRVCAVPGHWQRRATCTLAQARAWALPVVLLGWVLLLDSFAVWPQALYPLGFGVAAWLALLAALGLPWAWAGGAWRSQVVALGGALLLLLGFALLRLPSGNVWDAVLDPGLWLLAQLVLLGGFRN
jgi:hypothetical protein